MKKMISKICLFLFIALIAVSCEDFPVDEDGLLITTRAECYVSNFDLYNTDHQTIKLGNAYVDTTAQVAIMYVKFGTPINNVWPRISLCEDAKLAPKITGWMDFSGSKMNMEFIEGDWKSGNPSDQLSERIVNNPSAFPSTAKRFTVIGGNLESKKDYIFLIVVSPLRSSDMEGLLMKYYYFVLLSFALTLVACDDDPVLLMDPVSALSNDCIKRSLPVAPNIVGNEIEFAYAMAIPNELGKLSSPQVVSSIAGATGTYFDTNSYYTNSSGQEIPVKVCSDSQTNGTTTVIDFTVDTCAATLRYYYIIPEEARGKDVQFSFSVKASNGQVAEYKLGPYKISKMDMAKNLSVTNDKCYLSFLNEGEAVHIYSKADLQANPSLAAKIDIMYAYSEKSDLSHAFYTSSSPKEYMGGTELPSGFVNNTKMIKVYGLQDRQLSDLQYSKFIDDLDFETIDMSKCTNYILGLKEEAGAWVETADGKYRAYVYINKASASEVTVSVKRYKM